ncbi:MAG: helix-turn-helix domain-containing protein [Pseudonocardiaceae bacterium]
MDIEEVSAIGARAWMILRRRGLSLEVVAGLAGITKQYLSALELGQRGFNRRGLIEDLANALGCSATSTYRYRPPSGGTTTLNCTAALVCSASPAGTWRLG